MEFNRFTLQVNRFTLQALLILTIVLPNPIFCLESCNFPAIFIFGDSNSDTGLKIQRGHSPISLDIQHVQLSDFLRRSQIIRKRGFFQNLLPKEDYFSRALYTFDIGQNDLTAGYKVNLSTDQVKAYVPDVLAQFSIVIKKLYSRGGRSFWIHNTGPVVTAAQIDKYGCSSPYNEVSKYFNLRLKEIVLQLQKELPLAAITYVDVYSVNYSLISQAKKLGKFCFYFFPHLCNKITGFENLFLVCCGHGGKYNHNRFAKCGSKKVVNGTEIVVAKSCKDPSVRISWDGTHFTEAANKWIFDQIVDGSYSDPPLSLEFACNRMNS
ncbi:Alpha-L-fucosidase [Handroanthus impetiginosus]|uniref:Alpha-L-fucosidase n=1 Tax=Handroanthus impetiginosus TaxID=429701 RepID=A0A2G9GFV8_9LAMI|nr:Alpha-L-fucosidase [Handroanthus impetiginosus]